MGLFARLNRPATRSFLQREYCCAEGVDLHRQCARERGVNGGHITPPPAPSRLSLALDPQLGRAHRHQHVALSLFSAISLAEDRHKNSIQVVCKCEWTFSVDHLSRFAEVLSACDRIPP